MYDLKLTYAFYRFGVSSSHRVGEPGQSRCQDSSETLGAEISELADLLRRKRAEERGKNQEQDYDMLSRTSSGTKADTSSAGNDNSSQEETLKQMVHMNMMMQNMQRSMMIQRQMYEEETKKRETDELRMEIKKIELLLLQKGVSESQAQLPSQHPGSVRARVGCKRPLPQASHDVDKGRTPNASEVDANNEKGNVKKKYTNQKLPPELILTRFTKDGPKAANKISWSGEDSKKDSYDWKRQKKSEPREEEDEVADETSDEDEDKKR